MAASNALWCGIRMCATHAARRQAGRALQVPARRASSTNAGGTTATAASPQRRVTFSGIQPTGIPHLGNYLGALQNWVEMQNSMASDGNDELLFSIVGYHALTVPQKREELVQGRRDMMATLLAVGLDPNRVTLFMQDEISEHAELAWILNCLTPMGWLKRMTTWKSKLATIRDVQSEDDIDDSGLCLGLFAYPVLQAADILLYRATHVPVGEDQVQHLELSRDIADLFNRTHDTNFFPLPQTIITPMKRVLSLRDPTQKMSKSAPDASSRILLTDDERAIQSKIKRAVTDSDGHLAYDPAARPGVGNLLSILAALDATRDAHGWADELNTRAGGAPAGRILKEAVGEAVIASVSPIRNEFARLKQDPGHLDAMRRLGRDKAQERASSTMQSVRKLVGLYP